ncbi:MAG: putative lipoprotein [Oceanicoccus sp.]
MKIILIVLSLTLMSCAYSPQQLSINPVVGGYNERYGNNRPVTIVVEDQRQNKDVGTRGGVYENTSVISLVNNLDSAVAVAAIAKLAAEGFMVNSLQKDTAVLKIIIDRLDYDIPKDLVAKKVNLEALLRVEASYAGETYHGQYKTQETKQTVITPTMKQNEKMINGLLSTTLQRLFSDPKLKTFLSNI